MFGILINSLITCFRSLILNDVAASSARAGPTFSKNLLVLGTANIQLDLLIHCVYVLKTQGMSRQAKRR